MISLSSYASNPNGFGTGTQADLSDLQKALEAGYQISSQTGGSALRVESLEASLKVVTYNARHIKFWKKIPKSPAYSTVEEYNELSSYGNDAFAFVNEGELPPSQDSTYTRKTALVKYVGTTREVSHPMTAVYPAHGDVIAQENRNGILWLLNKVELSLFKGDATLAFNGQASQWSGLDALIDATSVIDLEGGAMQEADIEEGSNQLVEQFAYPTDLWLGARVASDLVKTMYPRERVSLPAPQDGQIGMSVTSVMTQAGPMELNPNIFLRRLPVPPSAALSANAPNTPTVAAAVNAGVTNGAFSKGAPAGANEYNYVVTSANRFGESAPSTILVANVSISAAQKAAFRRIDVTVTNPAVIGSFPPEYIRVYRTSAIASGGAVPTSLADFSLIGQQPVTSQAALGTVVFQDVNFLLPFTEIAYMGEMTPSVLTFRQLLPMMRMDLAVTSPSYRWMVLLYGTPILFAPKKWLRFINIGRLT